ncbi:MAG: TIGR03915 family putative DNA repair protein [Gemmatimonadota bacterium]
MVRFDGTYAGWRAAARAALARGRSPESLYFLSVGHQESLWPATAPAELPLDAVSARVSRRFLTLAALVACHRDDARWGLLYRALWRLTHGERHLLELATDDDVHRLTRMGKAVKRAAHKMTAFVRFRHTGSAPGEPDEYVAWFEPEHHVVERTAPFFARRFAAMRWTILTPERSARWDGTSLLFGPGARRASAPSADELEELWRAYYTSIFNPARVNPRAMRAEMPKGYWKNLPEARLIPTLVAEAPARTAAMLRRVQAPAEPLPAELEALDAPAPPEALVQAASPLDLPGADPIHDPGIGTAVRRAGRVRLRRPEGVTLPDGRRLLAGVASWTDPTLVHPGAFYPSDATDAESRLRYYASMYPMVEVDATYYALPTRAMAVAWAARTPAHFIFHVKAHALMTGHPADVRRLPDWLRRQLPGGAVQAGRVYGKDLPPLLLDDVWHRFLAALDPLTTAQKLGAIFLQLPPWFRPTREAAATLRDMRARLGSQLAAVEFRCGEWMAPRIAPRTLALLESLEFAYTVVDGPQGMSSSMPATVAVTSPRLAVIRLHGRRVETWERPNAIVTERYRYLYDRGQLAKTADQVEKLLEWKGPAVHVVFNNNHGNYGTTNALELTELLAERVPVH